MHFKRLELFGFKSFADRTAIQFQPGVTAIVGPNGCGKSNVSDAIRWVLGEQSAKSLRGSSMNDVIFNGTHLKEPLNFAEVSLTLSNESRLLPIDYEEVTVSRRLYRSGESEYLINKNPVRLKDVSELLMGTGIGTESYSLIEQGKMDLILNAKPEERREIFEEAAGITKYKSKKKEALRKLDQTEQNLVRVHDIIAEVKRQIGSIERQAKKAEVYKIEFEKLKKLELTVASREFLIFEETRKTKEQGMEGLKAEEEKFLSEVKTIEQRCHEARGRLAAFEAEIKDCQIREMTVAAQMRASQDRGLLNRERIGELSARREQITAQIQISKRRLEEFEREAARLNAEFETIRSQEGEAVSFFDSVEADFGRFERVLGESVSREESLKRDILEVARKKAEVQNSRVKIHAQRDGFAHQLRKLNNEEKSLLDEIRHADESINPPLFKDGDGEPSVRQRFELKIRDFKEKIYSIFKGIFERGAQEISSAEESALDGEVRRFADDIVKIQGQNADEYARLNHLEESKRKMEHKLSLVAAESEALLSEQRSLDEKESALDAEMLLLEQEEKSLDQALVETQGALKALAGEKESLVIRLAETRSRQSHESSKREKMQKDLSWVLESKNNELAQLTLLEKEIEDIGTRRQALESENVNLESELAGLSLSRDEILRRAEGIEIERAHLQPELAKLEEEREGRFEFLQGARDRIHAFELENTGIRFEIDRLKERIFNAYQVDILSEFAGFLGEEEVDMQAAKAEMQSQREKIAKMGPVNLVAIQEFDEMRERFDFLTKQEQDLSQAKDDLHKAILKINRTTRELFTETFERIQKHFTEYFRLLFGGGNAELVLLDENDVLESGIEIVARPPGKKLQSITLLSGGEKALTATALVFSLFKVKPSPFCVLDEIDAPLDESNVDRFCGVLKEFIAQSQFILITHNKRTMNLADVMYGVTMAETGVSKIISVKFSDKARANGHLSANLQETLA
jgi:chromosome segregation protein